MRIGSNELFRRTIQIRTSLVDGAAGAAKRAQSPAGLRQTVRLFTSSADMEKEGTEIVEETEQMIDQKEPENPVPTVVDSKEMRAVVLTGFGGLNKLKVTKKPMPEPQEGEVKIRVKAW